MLVCWSVGHLLSYHCGQANRKNNCHETSYNHGSQENFPLAPLSGWSQVKCLHQLLGYCWTYLYEQISAYEYADQRLNFLASAFCLLKSRI